MGQFKGHTGHARKTSPIRLFASVLFGGSRADRPKGSGSLSGDERFLSDWGERLGKGSEISINSTLTPVPSLEGEGVLGHAPRPA